jgi:hypothetical protein
MNGFQILDECMNFRSIYTNEFAVHDCIAKCQGLVEQGPQSMRNKIGPKRFLTQTLGYWKTFIENDFCSHDKPHCHQNGLAGLLNAVCGKYVNQVVWLQGGGSNRHYYDACHLCSQRRVATSLPPKV